MADPAENIDDPGGNPGGDPGANTGIDDNWKASLPEVLQNAPFIKDAETVDLALDQITNAASHMGNSLRIPSAEASEADLKNFYEKLAEKAPGVMVKPDADNADVMRAFYKSLGMPDESSGYKFELEEGESMPSDLDNFAKIAHENGLTQKQFEGILKSVMAGTKEANETAAAQMRDEMVALAGEWGLGFENKMGMVKNFLKLTGAPEGLLTMLQDGEMASEEIKWIYDIAQQTKSPTELAEQPEPASDVVSPAEARNQIEEIMQNKSHPYWNPTDPRNKDAIRKMVKLQKMANPEASTDPADLLA